MRVIGILSSSFISTYLLISLSDKVLISSEGGENLHWNLTATCLNRGSAGREDLESLFTLLFSVCWRNERTSGWLSRLDWWISDLLDDLEDNNIIMSIFYSYSRPKWSFQRVAQRNKMKFYKLTTEKLNVY